VTPYEHHWSRPLYEAYAQQMRVVYLDPDPTLGTRGPIASLTVPRGRDDIARGVVHAPLPGMFPGNRFQVLSTLNRWYGTRSVLRILQRTQCDEVVLVVQRPDLLPTLRGLPARLRVYDVVDDYESLAETPAAARHVARAHRRMLNQCDIVWTTSRTLAERIRPYRADVIESTNGVDVDAFVRGAASAPPTALATVPHPRVGLIGRLNDRVDWPLVEEICRTRPDWHVVIIGPEYAAGTDTTAALARLACYPNAHRIAAIPPDAMPACVAALDVCLIPYRLTRLTLAINPLKVYQYLAAGKPVVATRLPALIPFGDEIACATGADEFVDAIEAALAGVRDPGIQRGRQEYVRQFDWTVVAETRLRVLSRALDRAV
jgi:glycosyltransferase involved in cell wall biosynthesis